MRNKSIRAKLPIMLPIMIYGQKVAITESGSILYNGKEILASKINKVISTEITFFLFGVIPIHVWDIEVIDENGESVALKNISRIGNETLLKMSETNNFEFIENKPETGLIFENVARDTNQRMSKQITYVMLAVTLILLLVTMYTYTFK